MTTKVFVYGSLKRGYWNNSLLSTAKFIGEAFTIDGSYTMYDGGFPYVVLGGDDDVSGEVWEVDDDTLRNLDRLEGVPDHYVRHETEVVFDTTTGIIDHMIGSECCNVIMYVASPSSKQYIEESKMNNVIEPDEWGLLVWSAE